MSEPDHLERWKAETTAFDRVSSVAQTVDQPRSAGWIADEAAVAENTARKHLGRLEKLGVVLTVDEGGTTKYEPDPLYLRMQSLREVLAENDLDELVEKKAGLQESLEGLKADYDAEGPDELRQRAADVEDAAEIRELRKAASDWELVLHRLSVVTEAIERYDAYAR